MSLNRKFRVLGAAFMTGVMTSPAYAAEGNTFNDISANIINSIQDLPGLLSGLAYLFGLLLGVLGILKIKSHVENPQQAQLKDGAMRLVAGGALFALPTLFEAMAETIGTDGASVKAAQLAQTDGGGLL